MFCPQKATPHPGGFATILPSCLKLGALAQTIVTFTCPSVPWLNVNAPIPYCAATVHCRSSRSRPGQQLGLIPVAAKLGVRQVTIVTVTVSCFPRCIFCAPPVLLVIICLTARSNRKEKLTGNILKTQIWKNDRKEKKRREIKRAHLFPPVNCC